MQTTKARAKWLKGGNYPMWEVSHRDTGIKVWSDRPHDCASYLLDRFVLPSQIEARGGVDRCLTVRADVGEIDIEQFRKAMAAVPVGRLEIIPMAEQR
ncbi:hypothetical protein [Burkholderia sp. Bp8986]|uniref:hypothetical protein n=1 Tax=Burkholderia sp. Bp8986 TaxID=2184550 RepID=UPI000F5A0F64|nr:hypothetical protein [Burkholderia sp. Bp8986]RQS60394.1 hypothetical protein DID99_01740 [Burkholderia sp. Bp8986]